MRLNEFIDKYSFTRRFARESAFRAVAITYLSLAVNIIYAVFYGVISVAYGSWRNGALAAYYVVLSLMRFSIVRSSLYARKREKSESLSEFLWKKYLTVGCILTLTALGLLLFMILSSGSAAGKTYMGYFVYAIAAWTFFKITNAIIHIIGSRKSPSPLVSMIRVINLADALVSLLALQMTLLATFAGDEVYITQMNEITGIVTGALLLLMGIGMIIRAAVSLHKTPHEK